MHETGHSKPVHWDNPEGGMGRKVGGWFGMGRVTWKLMLPYVKQIANRNLLYVSGNSNRGSVSIWRGRISGEIGGFRK